MRHWNGWGSDEIEMAVPPKALDFLADHLGPPLATRTASFAEVVACVPASRLPQHPGVSTDPAVRLRHARGQSLPDWAALRFGAVDRYPAPPEDIQPTGAGPQPLPDAPYDWSELVWSARHEAVVHLDDLLLRRFRLGILLPDGGQSLLPQLRSALQADLGWDDGRWLAEAERYRQIWRRAHGKPEGWF